MTDKTKWGPFGTYTSITDPFGRLGYGFLSGNAGAITRGGYFNIYGNAGIFYVNTQYAPTNTYPDLGFRCASTPN